MLLVYVFVLSNTPRRGANGQIRLANVVLLDESVGTRHSGAAAATDQQTLMASKSYIQMEDNGWPVGGLKFQPI